MSTDRRLHVRTPGDRDIVLTRTFDAPARLVFAAYTVPDLVTRWYGARGWRVVSCEVDLRVGGRWRFVSHGPHGDHMAQSGTYLRIEEPRRLDYTEVFDDQSYPGETSITHDFAERPPGTTTLTSTIRLPSPEAREIVLRYPMTRGVGEAYERLDDLLTELATSPKETYL